MNIFLNGRPGQAGQAVTSYPVYAPSIRYREWKKARKNLTLVGSGDEVFRMSTET